MTVGKNTVSEEILRSFVERIERINNNIKDLQDDRTAVYAELKATGFSPPIVRAVVKRRALPPHDVQEADDLLDLYLHAMGMLPDPPLFRSIGLMGKDAHARDRILEKLKDMVPPGGEIIMKIGNPVRLSRDKDGTVTVEDYTPPPAMSDDEARPTAPARSKAPPPDVDAAGAEALGRQAAKNNEPVISNPFPFGDERRAKWDEGWRKGSGTDGMGPDD